MQSDVNTDRRFAMMLLTVFVSTGLILVWLNYLMYAKSQTEIGVHRHLALARVIENALGNIYLPLLRPAASLNDEEREQTRERLRRASNDILSGTGVVRFKIYDLSGKWVFAYPDTSAHIEFGAPQRARQALEGQTVSKLIQGDRPYDSEFVDKTMLETYVTTSSAMGSGKREPAGVIELYTDLTSEFENGRWGTPAQFAVLMTVLIILCGVLPAGMLRADRMIKEKHQRRSDYLDEIERATHRGVHGHQIKSEFLTLISHEIRTPMNTVIGASDLLLQTDVDARQRKYVESIAASGEALIKIIDQILELSSLKTTDLVLYEHNFRPSDLTQDMVRKFATAAGAKGLTLQYRNGPEIGTVVGDSYRVRQVLMQLLDNAIKFTETGHIVTSVQLAAETPEGVRLRFAVEDSGIGVSEAYQRQIFEPFATSESPVKRLRNGAGVGLAISHHLVHEMGGEIGLDGAGRAGSTFWFELPFKKATGCDPRPEAPSHAR